LGEHRADRSHLEEDPLNRLDPPCRIAGDQLAGLLGEIEQDRTGFGQRQRLAIRTIGIEDCWDLAIRVQGQEFRCPGLVLAGVDRVRLVGETDLLQHDRHLHPIGGRQRVELEVVWTLSRPALRNRKSGQVGHDDNP